MYIFILLCLTLNNVPICMSPSKLQIANRRCVQPAVCKWPPAWMWRTEPGRSSEVAHPLLQYQIFTAILIIREIQACWPQISAEYVIFSLLRIAMCEAVKPAFLRKVRYSLIVVESTQIKHFNCNLFYCSAGQSYPSAKIDGFIDDNKVEFLRRVYKHVAIKWKSFLDLDFKIGHGINLTTTSLRRCYEECTENFKSREQSHEPQSELFAHFQAAQGASTIIIKTWTKLLTIEPYFCFWSKKSENSVVWPKHVA